MKNITAMNLSKTMGIISAAAVVMPGAMARAAKAEGSQKPNVLIIMTDEQNFRTLGCYREILPPEQAFMWGKTVVETPNIDRIAKAGALCDRFYVTSPSCAPSRAAFMTGLYPQNAGVIVNNRPMDGSCITFAQVLKDNGYATGYIGKWHLESGMLGWTPKRKFGFDDNTYMWNRGHWKKLTDTPDGPSVLARTRDGKESTNLDRADEKSFTTDFITNKTINFINKNKDKPFCVMLSIPDPHGPDSVRAPYNTMYKDVKWEVARTYNAMSEDNPGWAEPMEKASTKQDQYYGMIKCIDDNVGRLLDTLEKNGVLENTMIIFTSDHGDMRGEHHKEDKGIPLDGCARVAFLVSYPGKIKPGSRVRDCVMGSVDFKPTLLSLIGVKDTSVTEGRDLSNVFLGQKHAGKDIVFTRCENWGQWTSAVSSNYKLIIDNSTLWLTDLNKDPDELKNFAYDPAYAPIVKEMASDLLNYMKTYKDPHLEAVPLGVKFLKEASQGIIKKMPPAELKAAKKQYPMKALTNLAKGKDND